MTLKLLVTPSDIVNKMSPPLEYDGPILSQPPFVKFSKCLFRSSGSAKKQLLFHKAGREDSNNT